MEDSTVINNSTFQVIITAYNFNLCNIFYP